jgi:hypothetical protein
MRFRSAVPAVIAVAVLVCHFNCLRETAHGAGVATDSAREAASGGDLPMESESSPRQQNESGCICRGAVLYAPVNIAPLDLSTWFAAIASPEPTAGSLLAFEPEPVGAITSAQIMAKPFSARKLRALLASFLI